MSEVQGKSNSRFLMAALFATGISGIVSEYVLATLATYILGDAVFQWTIILSLMLFSMGLGSRYSRYLEKNLLEKFIQTEILLSIFSSFCAVVTYFLMAFSDQVSLFIYILSISIGFLIGMEIPLVTRINGRYENLKANISSVMEKDYYGSLIGGIFFAFIGKKYLGLSYTPFVLGVINFSVALALFIKMRPEISEKFRKRIVLFFVLTGVLIAVGALKAKPIILFGEQSQFAHQVIFTKETQFQKIVVTEWKGKKTLFLNEGKQLSTFDEFLYHEPLVHPVMHMAKTPKRVLVLGAGDGCAVREALKFPTVEEVVLVELDPDMCRLGKYHPLFVSMNDSAYHSPKVTVVNGDAFNYLKDADILFDVAILDFPDPRNIELNRLYTWEIYKHLYNRLTPDGLMITQASSPHYMPNSYKIINLTLQEAGFRTLPIRNNVYTFGEWGWIIGSKTQNSQELKQKLITSDYESVETRWLNSDAAQSLVAFGKEWGEIRVREVNKLHEPVLYLVYRDELEGIFHY